LSYKKPKNFVVKMIESGEAKVFMSIQDTLIRSYMAGAILALSAVFALTVTITTGSALLGAILFPIGFIILYLMGFDLLTGVFVLIPLALLDKRKGVTLKSLIKNWNLVFLGNLLGSLTIAVMISFIFTYGYQTDPGVIGDKIALIGEARTIGYSEHGIFGWFTIFIRGMLCGWMVSIGIVGTVMTTSVIGKIAVMWMPIMLFFFMGFEHSIVNMFLFPFSIIMGGNFTILDYIFWNEIPTILGNLLGGLLFTVLTLYSTHHVKKLNDIE
jgi:formate transporter